MSRDNSSFATSEEKLEPMPGTPERPLLDCPCCGTRPGLWLDVGTWIACCLTPNGGCGLVLEGYTREAVIAAWNRRPATALAAKESKDAP